MLGDSPDAPVLSPQSIEALAQAMSGGSANDPSPSIGHHRQGWKDSPAKRDVERIGALRTHGGSAHAPELDQAPVDARMARFAIHSASTIALFLVETWERKQRHAAKSAPRMASAPSEVDPVAIQQAATA